MKRRFENPTDGRYWELGIHGSWLTTRTGGIGAPGGQHDSTMFKTVDEVMAESASRVEQKLAAGYREVPEPGELGFDAGSFWRLVAERSQRPLPELATAPAGELAAWRAVVEHADFGGWADRLVFADPCDPDETTLGGLIADMTTDVYGCALVCATFSNVEFLCGWDNDDERTYLVSRTPAKDGYHPVYWYVARFLELDGEGWPSMSSFLWRDRGDARELAAIEPGYLDPVALSRRSTWLSCGLAGVGTDSLEYDTRNAAGVASFAEEVELLAEHPHLALYWLLHHFVAGNTDMLESAVARTRDSAHPWVAELRRLVGDPGAAIGAVDAAYRDEFARHAPDRAFAARASLPEPRSE